MVAQYTPSVRKLLARRPTEDAMASAMLRTLFAKVLVGCDEVLLPAA